jgi:hypothetical protein
MSPPNLSSKETKETFSRLFGRLEALERGMIGTADHPGLVSKFEVFRVSLDHIEKSLKVNNWLTGLIAAALVAALLKMLALTT